MAPPPTETAPTPVVTCGAGGTGATNGPALATTAPSLPPPQAVDPLHTDTPVPDDDPNFDPFAPRPLLQRHDAPTRLAPPLTRNPSESGADYNTADEQTDDATIASRLYRLLTGTWTVSSPGLIEPDRGSFFPRYQFLGISFPTSVCPVPTILLIFPRHFPAFSTTLNSRRLSKRIFPRPPF